MELQLENLSVEELENLRSEIDSLILSKFNPKYKEEGCFINPKDLSFGYINGIVDTAYEIIINSYGNHHTTYVSEHYLDNCIIISQEDYNELYISKSDLLNELYEFRNEKYKEIQNFTESLEKKVKDKVQEMIKKYND
jgi:hypothetical protein